MNMTIEQARELMHEWTESPALRVHMECVAACMGAYASKLEPGETDRWIVAGLLHDFDYEKHPDASEHPTVGVAHLESLGVDKEILTAILGHAPYTGVARVCDGEDAVRGGRTVGVHRGVCEGSAGGGRDAAGQVGAQETEG
ncbi:MAG: HDIG domain-containing metalloprotein [Phycisphaerales bacterium]